jgi:hypothetical protein
MAVCAAVTASGVIWLTITDPVGMASAAPTGDIGSVLAAVASRVLSLIW